MTAPTEREMLCYAQGIADVSKRNVIVYLCANRTTVRVVWANEAIPDDAYWQAFVTPKGKALSS